MRPVGRVRGTCQASRTARSAALGALALFAAVGTAAAQSGGTVGPGGTATPPPSPATGPPADGEPPAASVRLREARARPGKAFYYGMKPSRFAIKLAAKKPTDLRIDIIGAKSGVLQRSLYAADVEPGATRIIPWDGLSSTGILAKGRLRFRVRGVNGEAIETSKKLTGKPKFVLLDHIFPVRGKHSWGDGLGAGRGHQGQDLPAKCGTKLVAARGGTVQTSAYQAGGAGYYVVIDGVGTDTDYAYLHMAGRPLVAAGETVKTGQPIGRVGSTGHSTGCHLHFEMWGAPGWYEGGSVMNPTRSLRVWDRFS